MPAVEILAVNILPAKRYGRNIVIGNLARERKESKDDYTTIGKRSAAYI